MVRGAGNVPLLEYLFFFNRETGSKVKNDKDICPVIDYFHVSEHFLRHY